MLQSIPPEISIASFSLIGVLTGYIWNEQNKKIKAILKVQEERKCDVVCSDIKSIKTDIAWVKEILDDKL